MKTSSLLGWNRVPSPSRLVSYTSIVAVLLPVAAYVEHAAAQDWPVQRHDSRRSGLQSVGVDIDIPGVLGTIPLGGTLSGRQWLVADADADGNDEVYLLSGGRLLSFDADGTLRWGTRPSALTGILAIDDLDGDGRSEVFAAGVRLGPIAFDALTGDELWQAHLADGQALGDTFPIDIDGDGIRELLVAEWGGASGGHGTAHIYAFPAGLRSDATVMGLDTSGHGYWWGRGMAVADLAGDGTKDLISASNDRIVAYDLSTGSPRWTSDALGAFPYGKVQLTTADIDGDGRDEIVVVSDNAGAVYPAAKRLMVLEVEADRLVLRWEMRLDPMADVQQVFRNNIVSLRSSDPPFIIASIFDSDSGHWRTLAIAGDSPTSAPTVSLMDRVVLGVLDLDGDGVSELLTLDAPQPGLQTFGMVRAVSLGSDGNFVQLWQASASSVYSAPGFWNNGRPSVVRTDRGVLLRQDSDGDGRADAIVEMGPGAARYDLRAGTFAADARTLGDAAGDNLWLSETDGRIARLDRELMLTNDSSPTDGKADLMVGTYEPPPAVTATSASGTLLATVDASGAIVVFRPSTGLDPVWRGVDFLALRKLTWLSGSPPHLLYAARETDGTISIVIRNGETSAELGRQALGPSPFTGLINDLLPLHTSDGTVVGVVVAMHDRPSGRMMYAIVNPEGSGRTDLDLSRIAVNGEYPVTAHDFDGDGVEDAVIIQARHTRIASGTTGAVMLEHENPQNGGMMGFLDLDGDGTLDVLHMGGFGPTPGKGARRLTTDLANVVWAVDQTNFHNPASVAPALSGGFHVGLTRRREAWFSAVDASGAVLATWIPAQGTSYPDLVTAEAAGQLTGIPTASAGVAADATGRSASFVFGSTDGYLYGVRAEDGTLAWSLAVRSAVGEPVASDVMGDGRSEIIVPAGDGNLYLVGPARLEAPSDIFDNDGTTVAGSDAADIDELPLSSHMGGDWTDVDGATGYEYRLVREDDLVITPWTDVGADTHAFLTGLSLEVGFRYFGYVRAYSRTDGHLEVGPELRSDGLVILDDQGPVVTLMATPRVIWRAGHGSPVSTLVHSVVSDAVGLRSYALSIQTSDGTTVTSSLAAGPAAGGERTIDVIWNGLDDTGAAVPPGLYDAVGVGTDLGGRSAETRVRVKVCTLDAPASLECVGTADGGVDSGSRPSETLAGGGGCGCAVGRSRTAERNALLACGLFMALFVVGRRRHS